MALKKKSSNTNKEKAKSILTEALSIKPSEITNIPWVYATRRKGKYPKSNSNSGKWLIFVKLSNLDIVWEKIKTATENGLLGDSAKTATAVNSPLASKPDLKVICVYTYDYTDKDDVMRIREELRTIGVVNKIPYKTDSATHQNLYEKKGDTRISVYYE